MQLSFAHRSPPRRPYSNVKSRFSSPNLEPRRLEEQGKKRAQRAVAASSKSKPWIAPPLPHNEMLARTYSASNFGSITALANQMFLNQSANSEPAWGGLCDPLCRKPATLSKPIQQRLQ